MAEVRGRYDAIVVGLGGMGSAALYHLAARGQRVLGLEQFNSPHDLGSSHGETRIIRLAYYEDAAYVPLLKRAFELWRELEEGAGERLFWVTGSLDAGPEESRIFTGSLQSCLDHDLEHEVLTSEEVARRFPAYRLPVGTMALYQSDGGFLLPERCISAHLQAARREGAEVRQEEPVVDWESTSAGVAVLTASGRYEAAQLIFTAGAWTGHLVTELATLAVPERQVLVWLQCAQPELFAPAHFPVFNLAVPEGRFYGLPEFGVPGFKFGKYHHLEEQVDPDAIDRSVNAADELLLREFAAAYFPAGSGPTLASKVCMFTNSPDEHFLIGRHRRHSRVVVAAGFSGHGYKFCSVVGEIVADLVTDGQTEHDISLFRLDRFDRGPG